MLRLRLLVVAIVALSATACSTTYPLMPTPHLYSEGHEALFGELEPALKTSRIPVFYVTDRKAEVDESGGLDYGYGRSQSLAYGETTVEIGEGLSWQQVVAASTTREREERLILELREVREVGRTPPTPFPFTVNNGLIVYPPDVQARVRDASRAFQRNLNAQLALTPRKEVLLYIHGYNNDFRDAVLTWAGMWHFFGREGVPVVYSWPAGRGGLGGYAYDRESGEFTVYHLKMLLEALASNPQVEGLRILAHSRGSDVLTSALRELFIEARAEGVDPLERFRIRHLVLAAPDLDFSVVRQRIQTEPLAPGTDGVTVYVSQSDKAIGLAEWLFSSAKRLGRLQVGDVQASELEMLEARHNLSVVELKGDGGSFGHAYFHENPAVSSDVMQALRFDREPGAGQGRPLEPQQGPFWTIRDDYLLAP